MTFPISHADLGGRIPSKKFSSVSGRKDLLRGASGKRWRRLGDASLPAEALAQTGVTMFSGLGQSNGNNFTGENLVNNF